MKELEAKSGDHQTKDSSSWDPGSVPNFMANHPLVCWLKISESVLKKLCCMCTIVECKLHFIYPYTLQMPRNITKYMN